MVASVPLKYALMVSVKATASGTVSAIPIVSGLGPRDEPTGIDVVFHVTEPVESIRFKLNGLLLPVGRAGI